MNLKEFDKLNLEQKSDEVFERAIRVEERTDGEFNYVLYQLHSFYVERKYELTTHNLIEIFAFEASSESLNLYLKEIELSDIFYL